MKFNSVLSCELRSDCQGSPQPGVTWALLGHPKKPRIPRNFSISWRKSPFLGILHQLFSLPSFHRG